MRCATHDYHWGCMFPFRVFKAQTAVVSVAEVVWLLSWSDDVVEIIQIYAFCFSQRINNLHFKSDREDFIIVSYTSAVCSRPTQPNVLLQHVKVLVLLVAVGGTTKYAHLQIIQVAVWGGRSDTLFGAVINSLLIFCWHVVQIKT